MYGGRFLAGSWFMRADMGRRALLVAMEKPVGSLSRTPLEMTGAPRGEAETGRRGSSFNVGAASCGGRWAGLKGAPEAAAVAAASWLKRVWWG